MSVALAVVTYVILALMLLIVGLAMPTFRRMHHNSFEFVHRVGLSRPGLRPRIDPCPVPRMDRRRISLGPNHPPPPRLQTSRPKTPRRDVRIMGLCARRSPHLQYRHALVWPPQSHGYAHPSFQARLTDELQVRHANPRILRPCLEEPSVRVAFVCDYRCSWTGRILDDHL